MSAHRTTFTDVAAAALAQGEPLLLEWLPDGRRQGREWVATNPTRADGSAGSFSVNLESGQWGDFATDAKGGDFVSLWAYLRGGIRQVDAAAELAARFGLPWGKGKSAAQGPLPLPVKASPARAHANPPQAKPAAPAPPHEGAPSLPVEVIHDSLGAPAARWTYTDAAGRPLQIICRWNPPGRKKVILPFAWIGGEWIWKHPPKPRALYNLAALAANPAALVVVCEGEKAADAAAALLDGLGIVTTTFSKGGKSWGESDWTPLAGRTVLLWPDNDATGKDAMAKIRAHLAAMGATVALAPLAPDLPPKFDAADIAPGDTARALELLGLLDDEEGEPQGQAAAKPQPQPAPSPAAHNPPQPARTEPAASAEPPAPVELWPMTSPPPTAYRTAGQRFAIAIAIATTTRTLPASEHAPARTEEIHRPMIAPVDGWQPLEPLRWDAARGYLFTR